MKGMNGVLLTVAVLGFAACGEEAPKPEEAMTEAEAKSLFVSLAKAPQGDPVSESAGKAVFNCADGGTVTVTGTATFDEGVTVDENGDSVPSLKIRLEQALTPEDCGVNGFVLNGDPAVNLDTEVTAVGLFFQNQTMVGTAEGSLKWRKGEDDGTCDIDMTLAAEADYGQDPPAIKGAYRGKLCGHEAEIDAAEVIRIEIEVEE